MERRGYDGVVGESDLQAKAKVDPDGENASVLFQTLVLSLNSTVPISSVRPANGPVPASVSSSSEYALVTMTEPSALAEARARPEPGSKRTHVTEALCKGLPRGGSSVWDRATQKLS